MANEAQERISIHRQLCHCLALCGRRCIDCLKPDMEQVAEGEQPSREEWGNRFTFFMSTLGMSVGLGQVWRFPTLAYKFGGGAFLLMYSVMIMMIGNSIFFFEIANGQYASKNPLRVFDKIPLLQGIGFSMIAYAYLMTTYYNHMVSYAIFYLYSSFTLQLPWTYCPDVEDFPDPVTCYPIPKFRNPNEDGVICGNRDFLFDTVKFCSDEAFGAAVRKNCCEAFEPPCPDPTELLTPKEICGAREYPSSYYWSHTVNKKYREDDPNYGYLGEVNYSLVITSFCAWLINYIALYKGLKSMGIIMYIMVPLPYVVLIIMFIVAILQDGAGFGLQKFFTPEWKSFLEVNTWRIATEQAFYSLGVAMGPLVTFGSYSKFNSPCHKDSTYICVAIIITSVMCSMVVFSVLGFLSKNTGRPFEEVVEIGPGLVFIVYPESLELLPGNIFWAIIFYLMLINLGSSTVSGVIETVSSAVYDIWPRTRSYKYVVNAVLLLSCFLIGIPITARGGLNVYEAFDTYAGGLPLIPICALELIAVIYIYGIARLCEDIAFMIGFYPNRYYRYQWLLGPFILLGICIYGMVTMETPDFKLWTLLLGWFLFSVVMGPIPVTMIVRCIAYSVQHRIKEVVKPPAHHGPKSEEKRTERAAFAAPQRIL